MFAVPVATPPAMPADTVATLVLLLLHTPDGVASAMDDVMPVQISGMPVITAGIGFTVTTAVTWHPVPIM